MLIPLSVNDTRQHLRFTVHCLPCRATSVNSALQILAMIRWRLHYNKSLCVRCPPVQSRETAGCCYRWYNIPLDPVADSHRECPSTWIQHGSNCVWVLDQHEARPCQIPPQRPPLPLGTTSTYTHYEVEHLIWMDG